jgi:hypothetical protein
LPPKLRRLACSVLVPVLLLSLPISAAGQTTTTTTTTTTTVDPGFEEVPVNLGTRSFDRVLPFDVPFQVTGPVPGGARKIEVQFMESRTEIEPQTLVPAAGDLKVLCAARRQAGAAANTGDTWLPDPPLRWERVGIIDDVAPGTPEDTPPATSTPNFRVTVPALDALRYYAFRFDFQIDPTPKQAEAFQLRAEPILDQELRSVNEGNLTLEDAERLRMKLIQALGEVTGSGYAIAPGTVFDPCTPLSDVRNEFLSRAQEILTPQGNRKRSAERIVLLRNTFRQDLEKVQASQDLDDLIAAVRTRAADAPVLAALLRDDNERTLQLASMSSGEADNIAFGVASQGGYDPNELTSTWSPDVADSFVANYTTTLGRLEALKVWVGHFVNGADPTLGGALSGPQVTNLRQLIGAVEKSRAGADSLQNESSRVRDDLRRRQAEVKELASDFKAQVRDELIVNATTTGNGNTFQAYYVSADLGYVYMPEISEAVPYVGTNIYFRPVNKNAPLSQRSSFGRRFAVTIGMTLNSIADENMETREDFTSNSSLLVGAGYRFTESIRLGLGALVFIKKDPNPLVDDETTGVTPYVSVSFDWNVAKTFKNIGSTFFNSAN